VGPDETRRDTRPFQQDDWTVVYRGVGRSLRRGNPDQGGRAEEKQSNAVAKETHHHVSRVSSSPRAGASPPDPFVPPSAERVMVSLRGRWPRGAERRQQDRRNVSSSSVHLSKRPSACLQPRPAR